MMDLLYPKLNVIGSFLKKNVTFFPPKAGLVWKFFPEGAQKSQTVLKPKAEGQTDSDSDSKLREPEFNQSISILGPVKLL